VRIGQSVGKVVLMAAMAPLLGCAHGPRKFEKIEHPAPLVRARAISLGRRQPDSQVVPALVGRLGDTDPVVRLAAHEELRKRTGQDFGYVPWATAEERSSAIDRWRAWLKRGSGGAPATPSPQLISPAILQGRMPPLNSNPAPSP
jgi:hypothetical protein